MGRTAEEIEESGTEEEDADCDACDYAGDCAGGKVFRIFEGRCS